MAARRIRTSVGNIGCKHAAHFGAKVLHKGGRERERERAGEGQFENRAQHHCLQQDGPQWAALTCCSR